MAAGPAPGAGAAAPGTKTVTVAILDDNVNDPNPAAATWGRVTSRPAGIDCPGDCAESFPAGSTVALTLARKPGFVLTEFGVFGNAAQPRCAASSCTLALDGEPGPAQVAVELRPEAQLLAVPEGAGTLRFSPVEAGRPAVECRIDPPLFGDLPAACSPRYRSGTRVAVTAVPDAAVPGARFVRWSDYRCAKRRTCTLTIRGKVYLNAIFSPVTLTVAGGDQGGGSFGPVVATPPGGTNGLCTFLPDASGDFPACRFRYPLNTRVTLRRDPAQATNPTDEWTGSCTGRGVTCALTMRENGYVRAGTERTVDIPERTRQAFTLVYEGPRGGVIRLRSTSAVASGTSFSCRSRTCARAGFRRGDTARITVSGSRRVRFVRWADPVPRRPNRQVTVGTLTRVKAIFRRR